MNGSQEATSPLALDGEARRTLWKVLIETIESYIETVEELPVSPFLDLVGIRGCAESFDFAHPIEPGEIVNQTRLPVICFTDGESELDLADCQRIANAVVPSGQAWISTIQVGKQKQPALRACITNHGTEPRHIDTLLAVLRQVRHSEQNG
jgi:hypothetical protein